MPTATRTPHFVMRGLEYAQGVAEGRVLACQWVRMACQRHLDDLQRWSAKDSPFYFDTEQANRVCDIIQHFPHIRGIWAKEQHKLVLEPWQCFIVSTVFGWMATATKQRRFRVVYIEVPRKNAKALALDTPVATPGGWKTISDIAAGDVVFDAEGLPTEVLATSEVFTDHECYCLTFSNGDSVVADAGHIWRTEAKVNQVGVRVGRQMGQAGQSVMVRDRTTEEVFSTQTYGGREDRNHSLHLPPPLQLPEAALDIDPYVLGAWLGDGTTAAAHITCGQQDVADMTEQIQACGYFVSCHPVSGAWRLVIRATEVDLFGDRVVGKRSALNFQYRLRLLHLLGNKHIPQIYLRSSFEQRLALLQGLMDTDGTVSKNGLNLSFTTTNASLCLQVSELLSSLGIKSAVHQSPLVCNGVPVPGVGYRIQFHVFREMPVFRLPRKLGRMRLQSESQRRPRSQTVQIIAVEKVPSVPVKCITVASRSEIFLCGRTMLPTHNSTLTSAIGLYLLACGGEQGAHIVSAASALHQAKLVFTDAQLMARREAGFRQKFGVEVLAHSIVQIDTASRFEAMSAEYSNLDGLNLHAALIDELHAHSTRGLWDVLATATGSRTQPLIWAITTAGLDRASVCYDQRGHVCGILQRRVEDESYFGIIFTRDDGDDPFEEATWKKANPNYGISVHPEGLRADAKRAMQMPSEQVAFFTKHLDIWVNAAMAWLPAGAWDKCGDTTLDIEDLAGQSCYIGIDLALRSDIAALLVCFPPEGSRDTWAVFGRYFLPEDTVNRTENSHYQAWEAMGRLTATPGTITDFDYIISALGDLCQRFHVREMCLDPYDAGPLINDLQKAGLKKPVEIRQIAPNMHPAMVELEGLCLNRKIAHDGDPMLAWMMSNVKVKRAGDLMSPTKDSPEKKIDGVVCLLMCLHRAMKSAGHHAYESRGIWSV